MRKYIARIFIPCLFSTIFFPMQGKCYLHTLADEVHIGIMSPFLDVRSAIALGQTCKPQQLLFNKGSDQTRAKAAHLIKQSQKAKSDERAKIVSQITEDEKLFLSAIYITIGVA